MKNLLIIIAAFAATAALADVESDVAAEIPTTDAETAETDAAETESAALGDTALEPSDTAGETGDTAPETGDTAPDQTVQMSDLIARLNASVEGRRLLHGTDKTTRTQTVDTNALTRTTITTSVYADGFTYVTTNVATFRIVKITPKVDENSLPERLKQLREERAANARTNWVYSISGRVQRAPRKFSVMRVTYALQKAGYWPQVEAYMQQSGLLPLYYTANDFREDDPLFIQGVATLQAQLGLTSDQIEAILSQSLYRE